MENLKYILLTTLFLFSLLISSAAEQAGITIASLPLHIKITEMEESLAPFIVGGDLIFSYTPSRESVRHVGISFENENFSEIHNLYRNENGIYFFIYKYPKEKVINYKFIEDGIWTSDKNSVKSVRDNNYITLSSFEIPDKNIKEHISPFITGNRATFIIRAEAGSSIYLTGDFNNWNPFLYKMKEETPGIFKLSINLTAGQFGYYFIHNGERVLDSENPLQGRSRIGEVVSLFTIK